MSHWTDRTLSDHKRHKSRLIAPWNQTLSGKLRLSDWRLTRVPEVIWISELISHLGPKRSLDVLSEMASAAFVTRKKEQPCLPPLASYWASIPPSTRNFVERNLRANDMEQDVAKGLHVLAALYPEYPLRFLSPSCDIASLNEGALNAFKDRLSSLLNRFSVLAVRVHCHIVIAEIRSGQMRVFEGMEFPNFDAVYSDPVDEDSDDFKHAAGFSRASAFGAFSMATETGLPSTSEYFWNRGLDLDRCQPAPISNEDDNE